MWQPEKQENRRSTYPLSSEGLPTSASTRPESSEAIVAFIGKGVEFKGTISYSRTVRIDGLLDGEIHTDGSLLVGEGAVITAKVTAGTIVCMGKMTGDVTAKEKIKLQSPAVLNGGVKTPVLSIEEGVLFNGSLEMTQMIREVPREIPRELPREKPVRVVEDSETAPLKRANA